MNRTKIEWARNPDGSPGYTWNPISGCLNHDNGLCKGGGFPCYAYKLANGRLKPLYLANKNGLPYSIFNKSLHEEIKAEQDPFYPRFWEERLYDFRLIPYRDIQPKQRGVFVCDMGDLFGIGIPDEWTRQVLAECEEAPHNRFYLLTKQPQNLIKFSPFPDNAWVGVTATNELSYVEAVAELANIEAKVKYLSFEPLLERVRNTGAFMKSAGINWLIIGACTGTNSELTYLNQKYPDLTLMSSPDCLNIKRWTAQPKIEWVREIVEAADKAGVKVFLKDNLAPLIKWPQDGPWAFKNLSNMLRQEMPEIK